MEFLKCSGNTLGFGTHPATTHSDCKNDAIKGEPRMLGWIILFGLMSLCGVTILASELPRPTMASVAASLLFMLLLVISLMARVLRSRA
jgi:hypothetical protein